MRSTLLGRNEFFRQTSVVLVHPLFNNNNNNIRTHPRQSLLYYSSTSVTTHVQHCSRCIYCVRILYYIYIYIHNIYIHIQYTLTIYIYIYLPTIYIYTYLPPAHRPCGGEIRGVRALTAPKSIGRENFANLSFTPARALRVRVCACARCKNGDEVKTLAKRCFNYILYYCMCVCVCVCV